MTEKLFSLEYGVAGICVLLTIMVLVKVGEFLWSLKEKKDSLSEKTTKKLIKVVQDNTMAISLLDQRIKGVELSLSELPKMKTDIRRFFSAIKCIAADKWPNIRDEIMKDDITS